MSGGSAGGPHHQSQWKERAVSARTDVVEEYFEGFRRTDRALILACLTDDVVWDLPGYRHLTGKAAFDGEIVNEDFTGSPQLTVDRMVEQDDIVVAIGSGLATQRSGALHRFPFTDLFQFRGELIRRVESYLVPLAEPQAPSATSDDERQVRGLIERWVSAVHTGDLDTVLADHSNDIVMFDVPPPKDGVRGIDAYRETWPPFFEWQRAGASFELVKLDVTAGSDVAFAHALLRCGTAAALTEDPAHRLRLTIGLCKHDGRWIVEHEHHSFPAT
jgi:uncharacterized protein (TIGR02246 family)